MNNNRRKFQDLLRGLFQFDSADLDFGIYRIMNFKRDVIERFIEKDLLDAVSSELQRGILAQQSAAAEELDEVKKEITETLGEEALDHDGNLAEKYKSTPVGKRYLKLKKKASGAKAKPAVEATIFNHLYTFFSRYYDNGDFMSKRRYSKREKFAVPYNGEEVYLHWANKDQYYIKTGEHFTDYSFKSQGITVRFKLRSARVEQDNVKGDKRFFLPQYRDVTHDKKGKEVFIPFEYRPLTDQEEITYGKRNQQDKIIAEAIEKISKKFEKDRDALAALMREQRKAADGQPVSYLEHHLRRYTRRNTSDFFIHKDLEAFLKRELDFYLKNEVLNLDELETGGEDRAESWFQVMRVMKSVGHKIIAFLAQIENFQKKLFEKKKFITETHYCMTVAHVPEGFYGEIAANDVQWKEWQELFHIDEEERDLFTPKGKKKRRVAFLKTHPTLALDTRHFDPEFNDRLLGSFEDLDEETDGLLIHGENFQALNLLVEKYRERVKCIYIDPPYNTGSDEFVYKDNYRHSSWLSLMYDRMRMAQRLFSSGNGTLWINLDDNEVHRFVQFMSDVYGDATFVGNIAWKKTTGDNKPIFAFTHDNILVYKKTANTVCRRAGLTKEQRKAYSNPDNDPRGDWAPGDYRSKWTKAERPNLYYPIVHPKTKEEIYPDTYTDSPRVWGCSPETHEESVAQNLVWWGNELELKEPKKKRFLKDHAGVNIRSVWDDAGTNEDASRLLRDLFGIEKIYPTPKPPTLIEKVMRYSVDSGELIIDFFSGSGTTAHAVINLNREDGGRRRFILVEMGDYFDTVLLPRIKKVIFTPEWKDGKPKRAANKEEAERSPRIIKYMRLEGYEDTLNNIRFDEPSGQRALQFADYLLHYMLDFETKESETLLHVEKLVSPFDYKLMIHDGEETAQKPVDLPETFNYLLGLYVKSRRVYHDGDRRYLVYRGAVDHKEIVVIWRDTRGWGKEDLERDKEYVEREKITEGADVVYVNGDSFIPKARALDPVFMRRMFSEVQV